MTQIEFSGLRGASARGEWTVASRAGTVLVENTAYRSPGDGVDDAKMSNTGLQISTPELIAWAGPCVFRLRVLLW